jgi:hypothetical protein
VSHTAEPNDRRWYCVNTIGMATLCRDEADARREAADADAMWPRHAPHVATQLVPMAEIDRLRARVASLEESLHYANGVADLAMKHRDDAENRVAELEQDAEIGRKWRADSSLATWFPFTAEEIERLRGLIAAHVNASNNDDSAGDTFGALAEAVQDAP